MYCNKSRVENAANFRKIILDNDYSRQKRDYSQQLKYVQAVRDAFLGSDYEKKFDPVEPMRGTWKIDPDKKANFDSLLFDLDSMAKDLGYKIKSFLDYRFYYAYIEIYTGYCEFNQETSFDLLCDLNKKANCIVFQPVSQELLKITIRCDYFSLVATEEEQRWNERQYEETPFDLMIKKTISIIEKEAIAESDEERELCHILAQIEKEYHLDAIDSLIMISDKIKDGTLSLGFFLAAAKELQLDILPKLGESICAKNEP